MANSDIEKNVLVGAPIERVWAALTDAASIESWMGEDSDVQVDLRVGGHFLFFDGETTGAFTQIERPYVLEYTWRQREWEEDWLDSLVHWELTPIDGGIQVSLTHSRLPNIEERDGHDEGWDSYFLGPMKDWLEME